MAKTASHGLVLTTALSPCLGGAVTEAKLLVLPYAIASLLLISAASVEAKGENQPAPRSAETKRKANVPTKMSELPGDRARAQAKNALKRSHEADSSNKELVAKRLAGLAKTWAKIAKTEERASSLEAKASTLEKKTLELKAQAKRASSLVEQAEARRARALGRLKQLGLSDASPQSPVKETVASEQKKATASTKKGDK